MKIPPLRILVVDDEPANRLLIERLLARGGHVCVGAETGEDALDIFGREPFDVVLMDVMLPGINGFETAIRLRQMRTEWFPILFLSALSEPIDVVAALDAGGDDYITKPVDIDILPARIAALYRIAQQQKLAQDQASQLRRYYELAEREKEAARYLFSHLRRDDQLATSRADVTSIGAEHLSGDLVAVREAPDGRVQLVLADAAGHGLLAASQLFPLIEMFNEQAERGYAMPTVIARASALLREITPTGNFISACFATIDPHTRILEIWNFGMQDVLLLDGEGVIFRRFPSKFTALGIEEVLPEQLEPERAEVRPGQLLFLHTDGLLDARRADGERFGWARLEALLPQMVERGASRFVVEGMRKFLEGSNAGDDVTVCVYPIPGDPWLHLRDRPLPAHPAGALSRCGATLMVRLGPRELSKPDPVADVAATLRRLSDIEPRVFQRMFTVVRQLTRNAIDWGILGLSPELDKVTLEAERWQRLRNLDTGFIEIDVARLEDNLGCAWWEIILLDSGAGFSADTWQARRRENAWGGLDIVHRLCSSIDFSGDGCRIRVLLEG